jgi:hypothetical protein
MKSKLVPPEDHKHRVLGRYFNDLMALFKKRLELCRLDLPFAGHDAKRLIELLDEIVYVRHLLGYDSKHIDKDDD